MVRSPRCALHGAQPSAAAGNPSRGQAASASPTAGLAKKKKKKRNKKKAGGMPLGEEQEAGAGSRKFPAENSAGGGGESPFPIPATPTPTPKIIWKLLPTSSGTSDTFLHFQADKALSRESPGCPLGRGKGPCEPISPRLPSDPAPIHKSVSVAAGQRAAWGCRARGAASALLRERLVLGWSLVFIFDLFFIL